MADSKAVPPRGTQGAIHFRRRLSQCLNPRTFLMCNWYSPARRSFVILWIRTVTSGTGGFIPLSRIFRQLYFLHRVPSAIESIAVLPLTNATSNSEMDYLADGITEGVINHLSRLPGLRVMARTTVFRYRGAQQDPLQIGRDLKVGAVIVGRLNQHGDTLNVETEMVDVSNGSQIWGEQYQRKASDIATLQDDIASDISGQLRMKAGGGKEEK